VTYVTHGIPAGNSAVPSQSAKTLMHCGKPLLGAATRWCGTCGHVVLAADVSHDFVPVAAGGAR